MIHSQGTIWFDSKILHRKNGRISEQVGHVGKRTRIVKASRKCIPNHGSVELANAQFPQLNIQHNEN